MTFKEENFKRIAENRINKIIEMISKLSNLSNPYYYEYSDEQVEKMFMAIQRELDKQKKEFDNAKKKNQRFEL